VPIPKGKKALTLFLDAELVRAIRHAAIDAEKSPSQWAEPILDAALGRGPARGSAPNGARRKGPDAAPAGSGRRASVVD